MQEQDTPSLPSFANHPDIQKIKALALDEHAIQKIHSKERGVAQQNAALFEGFVFSFLAEGLLYSGYYVRQKGERKVPAIIYNRGGTGIFGAIKTGDMFTGTIALLVNAGYIVIGSQCMGFMEGGARDEMGGTDTFSVLKLKEFLNMDDRSDPRRIGIWGGSRGGITTWQILARVPWVGAVVVANPMSDLFINQKFRPEMKQHFIDTFGGSEESLRARSGTHLAEHISKTTPILILVGSADNRVSPLESLELSKKFLINQIPHRLVLFEGADHYLAPHQDEAGVLTLSWFERFLKNEEPLPDMAPRGI